jgi:hypothetical protein
MSACGRPVYLTGYEPAEGHAAHPKITAIGGGRYLLYLNIRFNEPEETETIENEVSAYIYANNVPLVWLDNGQGTVMAAVNNCAVNNILCKVVNLPEYTL